MLLQMDGNATYQALTLRPRRALSLCLAVDDELLYITNLIYAQRASRDEHEIHHPPRHVFDESLCGPLPSRDANSRSGANAAAK